MTVGDTKQDLPFTMNVTQRSLAGTDSDSPAKVIDMAYFVMTFQIPSTLAHKIRI